MERRPLGQTGMNVTPVAFGAFKIGRNQKTKYREAYDLPDMIAVERLLNGVLDAGIDYIDTAPAYGLSEERIGAALGHRRQDFVLSTKVGEIFEAGESRYDFSAAGVRASVAESLRRLRTDVLDLVFIHANSDDLEIQQSTDVVATLQSLKQAGHIRAIGLSGKTVAGAQHALAWADAIMVEYHLDDPSHAEVMQAAAAKGLGVVVKKGLASGNLDASGAVKFVLGNRAVSSLVVGGLNLEHIRSNIASAGG